MAFSLSKLKSILNSGNKDGQLAGSGSLEPEIGFKLSYNPVSKCLIVSIIGARHLPSLFGLSRAHGYLVKVKLFPGNAKFETQLQETSWPVWNEEFRFNITQKDTGKSQIKADLATQLAGHFLSFTIYAVLETAANREDEKKKMKTLETSKKYKTDADLKSKTAGLFEKKIFSSLKGSSKTETTTTKTLLEKRRTIGAATWNFDSKLFQNDLKNCFIGTPDIWRPINAITSGLAGNDPRRENKKGQVEVCLEYTSSEDRLHDALRVGALRLRCGVTTMQEHEKLKAPLYIKMVILEAEKAETYWKSDRFLPTISARWDPKSSFAKLSLFTVNLPKVTIYVSLGCKNKMGKKEILGKAIIGPESAYVDSWRQCIQNPGVPVNVWLNLE